MPFRAPWFVSLLATTAALGAGEPPALIEPLSASTPARAGAVEPLAAVPADPEPLPAPRTSLAVGSWVAVAESTYLEARSARHLASPLPQLYCIGAISPTKAPDGQRVFWLMNGVSGWVRETSILDPDETIEKLGALIASKPSDANLLRYRGLVSLGKGIAYGSAGQKDLARLEFDQAIADFNDGLKLAPKNTEILLDRGIAQAQKGDLFRALADLNDVIPLVEKSHDLTFLVACLCRRGMLHQTRGQALLDSRELNLAVADFNAALRLDPKNGVVYRARDETLAAIREYNQRANQSRALPPAPTGGMSRMGMGEMMPIEGAMPVSP